MCTSSHPVVIDRSKFIASMKCAVSSVCIYALICIASVSLLAVKSQTVFARPKEGEALVYVLVV